MSTRNVLISSVVFLLLGCGSFNQITINQIRFTEQVSTTTGSGSQEPAAPRSLVNAELLCGPFTLPELPPVPELPIKELSRLSPANLTALDTLQQKHIEDLRKYIASTRKLIKIAHDRYLEDCQSISKTTSTP